MSGEEELTTRTMIFIFILFSAISFFIFTLARPDSLLQWLAYLAGSACVGLFALILFIGFWEALGPSSQMRSQKSTRRRSLNLRFCAESSNYARKGREETSPRKRQKNSNGYYLLGD